YVFIDDLDRCEVPHAADLMQAINLLLSADQPAPTPSGELTTPDANLFFLLGLDREVVAAGIAAKNRKILPYIAGSRRFAGLSPAETSRIGLNFGYEFLEKFIQVPFRVPELEKQQGDAWIERLTTTAPAGETPGAGEHAPSASSQAVSTTADEPSPIFAPGADPEMFADVVTTVVGALSFNPRRIKQFINVFRLQVLIF